MLLPGRFKVIVGRGQKLYGQGVDADVDEGVLRLPSTTVFHCQRPLNTLFGQLENKEKSYVCRHNHAGCRR